MMTAGLQNCIRVYFETIGSQQEILSNLRVAFREEIQKIYLTLPNIIYRDHSVELMRAISEYADGLTPSFACHEQFLIFLEPVMYIAELNAQLSILNKQVLVNTTVFHGGAQAKMNLDPSAIVIWPKETCHFQLMIAKVIMADKYEQLGRMVDEEHISTNFNNSYEIYDKVLHRHSRHPKVLLGMLLHKDEGIIDRITDLPEVLRAFEFDLQPIKGIKGTRQIKQEIQIQRMTDVLEHLQRHKEKFDAQALAHIDYHHTRLYLALKQRQEKSVGQIDYYIVKQLANLNPKYFNSKENLMIANYLAHALGARADLDFRMGCEEKARAENIENKRRIATLIPNGFAHKILFYLEAALQAEQEADVIYINVEGYASFVTLLALDQAQFRDHIECYCQLLNTHLQQNKNLLTSQVNGLYLSPQSQIWTSQGATMHNANGENNGEAFDQHLDFRK